jgi:glycerophosphoryl diester phosphodiesterase
MKGKQRRSTANRFLDLLRARRARPVVVAHRGDSFHAPENTLEAARLAWQAGAEAWEIDVRLSRDGVPVVLHDETLTRTTDVAARFAGDPRRRDGYRLADFDFSEVQTLDAGSWFVAGEGGPRCAQSFQTLSRLEPSQLEFYRSGHVKVPSLAEALSFTEAHDWLVNIEIKSFPGQAAGLVSRVLAVVADSGTASRVLISDFDHRDLSQANLPERAYALGILTAAPLARIGEYATALVGADTVHVSTPVIGAASMPDRQCASAESLRLDLIEELRTGGVPLLVYTVNEHGPGSLARYLAELGINGIFTDDPAGLVGDFGSRAITK